MAKYSRITKDVQANILKGHGRDHVLCVFIQFNTNRDNVSNWVKALPRSKKVKIDITFANEQFSDTYNYKQDKHKNPSSVKCNLLTCFYISRSGLEKLNIKGLKPSDSAFWEGVDNLKVPKNPSLPNQNSSESNLQPNVDAMILLAHNNKIELYKALDDLKDDLNKFKAGHIVIEEYGNTIRAKGQTVEHFGYVDGISQPKILKKGGAVHKRNCKKWVFDNFHGSYMVFYKIEQNVRQFNQNLDKISQNSDFLSPEMVGAQAIGRFKDGVPLTLKDSPGLNDFNYKGIRLFSDKKGARCPLHSHVRKMNPRDRSDKTKERKIIRRGITYGVRDFDLTDEPDKDVGLLFMSFQKSISKQFEPLIQEWANEPDLPSKGAGVDPIIGYSQNLGDRVYKWKTRWNQSPEKASKSNPSYIESEFESCVNFKWGEYFYAPPRTFFTNLEFMRPKSDNGYEKKNLRRRGRRRRR